MASGGLAHLDRRCQYVVGGGNLGKRVKNGSGFRSRKRMERQRKKRV